MAVARLVEGVITREGVGGGGAGARDDTGGEGPGGEDITEEGQGDAIAVGAIAAGFVTAAGAHGVTNHAAVAYLAWEGSTL